MRVLPVKSNSLLGTAKKTDWNSLLAKPSMKAETRAVSLIRRVVIDEDSVDKGAFTFSTNGCLQLSSSVTYGRALL